MLLKVFRRTTPGVILLIILMLGALWIRAFLDPQLPGNAVYEISPMPLYRILRYLLGAHPLAGVILSFLILSFLLFLMVNFNTTVFFINERTFLPAVIYVLFSALFPENQVLNPVLPASVFLMLAIIRIMDAYRKPGIASNFFDAGIMISIGSLFYANLIWFGILVIVGIALLRTGNIKEIAISILGLVTPYIVTIGLFYVMGRDLMEFFTDIIFNLFGETPGLPFRRLTIIVLIYSALILLVSAGFLMMQINSKKIKSRKTFYLLTWGLVISIALYIVLPSVSIEITWLTAIPASYLMVHYFVFARKKLVPEIIFTGFFLLIVLIQGFRLF
jgi:hypothetical protein